MSLKCHNGVLAETVIVEGSESLLLNVDKTAATAAKDPMMTFKNERFDAVITCRASRQVEEALHQEARFNGLTPSQLVRILVFNGLKARGIDVLGSSRKAAAS
jgi:hypothetical protein